jgi:Holliday junction resolvase RusA-like endonuclease
MGYKLVIEIPTEATDSNKILGVNKFVKHAIFKRVKRDIAVLVHGKAPEKPLELFKISVTRHGAKCLDYDNFIASLKPFLDGLTLAKIIKDDSWKFIRQINTDQKISTEKKLVIKVEEVVKDQSIAEYDQLLSAI